jgi:histone H3/H4
MMIHSPSVMKHFPNNVKQLSEKAQVVFLYLIEFILRHIQSTAQLIANHSYRTEITRRDVELTVLMLGCNYLLNLSPLQPYVSNSEPCNLHATKLPNSWQWSEEYQPPTKFSYQKRDYGRCFLLMSDRVVEELHSVLRVETLYLSSSSVTKLIRRVGADCGTAHQWRMKATMMMFHELLEYVATRVAYFANQLALSANRNVVTKEDFLLVRNILGFPPKPKQEQQLQNPPMQQPVAVESQRIALEGHTMDLS